MIHNPASAFAEHTFAVGIVTCVIASVLVGGKPGFDEERAIELKLASEPELARSIRLLPAVTPERIWELLCAADLFAFPSHREGMPNSLLEAMAMGVPSVAFAIPPVLEIAAGKGAPVIVPLLDSGAFAEALLRRADARRDILPGCLSRTGARSRRASGAPPQS